MSSTLLPISQLKALDRAKLIEFAVDEIVTANHTFLNSAKAIVALGSTKDLEVSLAKQIGAAKAKNSLKNAGQAVEVWAAVEGEYTTEKWWESLSYGDFVAVNRAMKKAMADGLKGCRHLADSGVFKMSAKCASAWCENFTNPAPVAAPAKAAEVAAEPTVSAPVTAEATPAAEVPATTPAAAEATTTASATTNKPAKPPTAESVNKLIEAAEAALLKLIDSGDEVAATKVIARTLDMKLKADQAAAAKWPAKTTVTQQVKAAA